MGLSKRMVRLINHYQRRGEERAKSTELRVSMEATMTGSASFVFLPPAMTPYPMPYPLRCSPIWSISSIRCATISTWQLLELRENSLEPRESGLELRELGLELNPLFSKLNGKP